MNPASPEHQPALRRVDDACKKSMVTWAIRDKDPRELVHVSTLKKHENGAACHCICYACGMPMVAINADKPASHFDVPGHQRKHFNHQSANLDNGQCNREIARKLALKLFVEQDVVLLPKRSRTQTLPSLVTLSLDQESSTNAERMKVVRRQFIDDWTVALYGSDGRICVVTVRATHDVDDYADASCVLSLVGVSDERLAGLDSGQILALLNDPESGPLWLRHRDDAKLDALNAEQLLAKENELIGDTPRDWLVDLNGKQRNETVLHWAIKNAVKKLGRLAVPEYLQPIEKIMPDGTREKQVARCGAGILRLENVRVEQRLGSMVPDIFCLARMEGASFPAVELMIEAAVTHAVDADKRRKILEMGVACLEIHSNRFQQVGLVPISQIEGTVGSNAYSKTWIAHPWISVEIAKTKSHLERRATAIQNEILAKKRAEAQLRVEQEKYEKWIDETDHQSLAKGYLKALRLKWDGKPAPRMGLAEVQTRDILNELNNRKIVEGNHIYLERIGGLLHTLDKIHRANSEDQMDELVDAFAKAVSSRYMDGESLPFRMFAMDTKRPQMSGVVIARYEEHRRILQMAIDAGEAGLARPTGFDSLLTLLFPGLTQAIDGGVATKAQLERTRANNEKIKLNQEARRALRAARMTLVKRGRDQQAQLARQEAVIAELRQVRNQYIWLQRLGPLPTSVQLYASVPGKFYDDSLDKMKLFKAAVAGQLSGHSVDGVLQEFEFKDTRDIGVAIDILLRAKLIRKP